MQLKTLVNYVKYSGLWFGLVVNPFHWQLQFDFLHPDELNPAMRGVYLSIGPVWVRGIIDNGTW